MQINPDDLKLLCEAIQDNAYNGSTGCGRGCCTIPACPFCGVGEKYDNTLNFHRIEHKKDCVTFLAARLWGEIE